MKRLIYGLALIGIASLGFAFMNKKERHKNISNKSDTCGCIIVMKHRRSGNQEVSRWYKYICGPNGATAKGNLQRKYDKIYSGTDFYIRLSSNWVLDRYCD